VLKKIKSPVNPKHKHKLFLHHRLNFYFRSRSLIKIPKTSLPPSSHIIHRSLSYGILSDIVVAAVSHVFACSCVVKCFRREFSVSKALRRCGREVESQKRRFLAINQLFAISLEMKFCFEPNSFEF
jgi:hypothetical protein